MSTIEAFRSSINKYTDFARNSRFTVEIPWGGAPGGVSATAETLTFRCEEAELPGRSFSTFEARTHGVFQKYPMQTTYNDINLTFLCSGNKTKGVNGSIENTGLIEKRLIEDWMNRIHEAPSVGSFLAPSWNFRYKNGITSYGTDMTGDGYVKNITITQYDVVGKSDTGTALREPGFNGGVSSKNQVLYSVVLVGAFPVSMNQISLSWGDDSVSRLIVTFAYDYWRTSKRYTSDDSDIDLQPPEPVTTQVPRITY